MEEKFDKFCENHNIPVGAVVMMTEEGQPKQIAYGSTEGNKKTAEDIAKKAVHQLLRVKKAALLGCPHCGNSEWEVQEEGRVFLRHKENCFYSSTYVDLASQGEVKSWNRRML